ncbi:MAG: RNA 2',3'-cyclic phosphodiesterase [Thermoactinomyces sp.]
MKQTLRLFIALVLPDEVKQHLAESCTVLKKKWKFSRWVCPEDYHITLYFLGDVSETGKEQILSSLSGCSAISRPFPLSLSGLGTFGCEKQPRVLWAGVSGDLSALHALQKQVSQAVGLLGFPSEKRAYRPHITLARKCQQHNFFLPPEAHSLFREVRWEADEFALYETRLGEQPMYRIIQKFKCSVSD